VTAPTIDAQLFFDAVKAAVVGEFGANVYEYGKAPGADGNPGVLPSKYLLLVVERRFVPPSRMSRTASRTGWRITGVGVGRYSPTNARDALTALATALDGQLLTVNGVVTTPIEFESGQAPVKEGASEWFSGFDAYTCAH
jgi:hypothetical protein